MRPTKFKVGLLFLSLGLTCGLHAFQPLWAPLALFAGSDRGSEDGPFLHNEFDHPGGLLFDAERERLIVCDTDNGLIRSVDRRHGGQVSTLGLAPGQPRQGSFGLTSPTGACWVVPGRTMAVLDPAAKALEIVQLDSVSPVARLVEGPNPHGPMIPAGVFRDAKDLDYAGGMLWVAGNGDRNWISLLALSGTAWAWRGSISPPNGSRGFFGVRAFNHKVFLIKRVPNAGQLFCLVGPGGVPIACSGSAVPMDLGAVSASVQVRGLPDWKPWAFVKDATNLAAVSDQPWLGLEYNGNGDALKHWATYDPQDRLIGLEDDFVIGKDNRVLWSDPKLVGRRWIYWPDFAAADPGHRAWYLCDPGDERAVLFRPIVNDDRRHEGWNSKGMHDYEYPVGHPSHVLRLAVAGGSISFLASDTQKRGDSFNKRLAWYLNWKASQRNLPQGYETVFVGADETMELSGESSMNRLRNQWNNILTDYQPDGFLLAFSVLDPFIAVDDFFKRPGDSEGLPSKVPDVEFALDPRPVKFAPDYKDLLAFVGKHPELAPQVSIDKKVRVFINRNNPPALLETALKEPKLLDAVLPITDRYFGAIEKRLKLYSKKRGVKVPLTIVFLPTGGQLSRGEGNMAGMELVPTEPFRSRIKSLALDHGFQFMDLTDSFRVYSASAGLVDATNNHYNRSGENLMGEIVAKNILENPERYCSSPVVAP